MEQILSHDFNERYMYSANACLGGKESIITIFALHLHTPKRITIISDGWSHYTGSSKPVVGYGAIRDSNQRPFDQ
jgi:hypothetical protein